ncbi:reverse transcriptase domain-containing protein, partial [Tanacetum coccineum]
LTTYKVLMEKTYTWIEAREVATNGAPNGRREGFNRSRKNPSYRFFSYRGSNHGMLSNLSKSPRKILATEKAKASDTQLGEWKKGDQDTAPVEAPILMISRDNQTPKRKSVEESVDDVGEITFPPVSNINSSDTVIIKARISGRQVNRVYMNSGSSCEVIYEHCFLKLKPSIRSLQIDSKTSLVGFSGEHSWPLGEVPLEITIGDSPYIRTEILNFVIVRSNSPYNLLLGRIAIQRMGIVVSTIHEAIKFYTPKGIGIVFSIRESDKAKEEQKKLKGISQKTLNGILSYVDAKERIVVNEEYPKQTIVIGRQLSTSFKMKLQGLLRAPIERVQTHRVGQAKEEESSTREERSNVFHRHKQGLSKRPSSLPVIDQKVEILSKFWLKCFLYAYKGYHQIQMAERDEEKTAFFTRGVFCYKRLPFGLKNA